MTGDVSGPLVASIIYYPVKSLAGIPLDEAVLTTRGVRGDRMWMIARASGQFVTQREEHSLALLSVSEKESGIEIRAPNGDAILLPRSPNTTDQVNVRIWKDDVQAITGSLESAAFISDYLDDACQFVAMPEDGDRMAGQSAPDGTALSFADAYPGLLISQASVDDVDYRSSIPIEIRRFRPNIVATNCDAYAEDAWKRIMIGTAVIDCVKPCERCVLTTVDPDLGTAGKEPLSTLAEYRRRGSNVLFGENFVVHQVGTIHVGDKITVTETKPPIF